jgi:hypothetical protein
LKAPILISGMHGLGDNLHERSIVKKYMENYDVWLETPWPSIFHDLNIKLITKSSNLRTQAKNLKREFSKFTSEQPPYNAAQLRVSYPPEMVRLHGNVLAAMSAHCNVDVGDFSLPIKDEWDSRAKALIESWNTNKPILIYRPLVERNEWGGCRNRNPDKLAYSALFESIRERFFVVSVADLVDGVEWMVSESNQPDMMYHKGELDIEILAALFNRASLIFTSPGFAAPLSQAVGTPAVVVFGGYENAKSFLGGSKLAPYLGIDTVSPCECFSHRHSCVKEINIPLAKNRILEFVNEHC